MLDKVEDRVNICFSPCPVIFDLDGTLIDSAPDIHACVNAVLRQNGIAPLSLDRVRSFVGGGVDMLWTKIIAALRIDPAHKSDLIASFMARYHHGTALTQLFPGVVEALGTLADRGHPLGICTNKPLGPTLAILDHFGMAALFAHVIGGDSLPEKSRTLPQCALRLPGLGPIRCNRARSSSATANSMQTAPPPSRCPSCSSRVATSKAPSSRCRTRPPSTISQPCPR